MSRVIFSRFLTISYNKTMDSKDYYLWEDDRAYISPTVGRDETLQFVDTLRESVGKNNDLISSQTQRLGTDISPSLGGLTGSEGYFAQRYQTTPIETQVSALKATAQADALNKLMTNYRNQAQNRYNQAYRNAARRAGSGGGGSDDGTEARQLITNINNSKKDKQTTVDTTDWSGQIGRINQEPSGKEYTLIYRPPYKDPVKVYLNNLTETDDISSVTAKLGQGYNTQIKTLDGVRYIWMDTGQFAPSWYRVGAAGVPLGGN